MTRKLVLGLLLGIAVAAAGFALHQGRAMAAQPYPCDLGVPDGLAACQGYFTRVQGTSAQVLGSFDGVLSTQQSAQAFTNVNRSADLINDMNFYLYRGNGQQQMGAAFIVNHMMGGFNAGGGVGNGIAVARNNFNAWQQLVTAYGNAPPGANYGVNWSYMPAFTSFCGTKTGPPNNEYPPTFRTLNSMYLRAINDDVFHATVCYPPLNFGFATGTPEIVFYWPGGQFAIGRPCGNIEMTAAMPKQDRPPVGKITVVCNLKTNSQDATITFNDPDGATTAYITTVTGWKSPDARSPNSLPYTVTINIPPPPTTDPWTSRPVTLHVRNAGFFGPYELTWAAPTQVPCATFQCGNLSLNPAVVDPYMTFQANVTVTNNFRSQPPAASMRLIVTPYPGGAYNQIQPAGWNGGASTGSFTVGPTKGVGTYLATWTLTVGTISTQCQANFNVVYLPYLHAYGGDVSAGQSALYDPNGGTPCTGLDMKSGVFSWTNPDFSGGGAQYAVEALQQIEGFASAVNSSSAPPTALAFANHYNPADATKLSQAQGLFGGYFGASALECDFTSDIGSPPQPGGSVSLPPVVSGQVIVYAKGDVFISHDIVYNNPNGWTSPNQIPYFRLVVVDGGIYIDPSVKQLDGLYVAERDITVPDGGTQGRIFTCALKSGVPVDLSQPKSYTTCNRQLVVNGAFVAEGAEFLRTYGSVGLAKPGDPVSPNTAAEVFNYTPELWLPRGYNPPNSGYAAITGLPPVL